MTSFNRKIGAATSSVLETDEDSKAIAMYLQEMQANMSDADLITVMGFDGCEIEIIKKGERG